MMMEADVVMGRLFGENDSVAKRPVMAHPPETESDITLTDFVNTIIMVRKLLYTCDGMEGNLSTIFPKHKSLKYFIGFRLFQVMKISKKVSNSILKVLMLHMVA